VVARFGSAHASGKITLVLGDGQRNSFGRCEFWAIAGFYAHSAIRYVAEMRADSHFHEILSQSDQSGCRILPKSCIQIDYFRDQTIAQIVASGMWPGASESTAETYGRGQLHLAIKGGGSRRLP
jgi:hypothetical protein